MPFSINWLDVTIAIILILSLVQGIRTGLIRSVFNIAGVLAGIITAMNYYTLLGSFILEYIYFPEIAVNVFSFIIIFSFTVVIVHLIGSVFHSVTGFSPVRIADKLGGSTLGLVIGLTVVGILLILMTSFPVYAEFPDQVEKSYMAPVIMDITTVVYDSLSEVLPFKLPLINTYPESLVTYIDTVGAYTDKQGTNYKELDQSTCFVCSEPVDFMGYVDNGKGSVSPKFICSGCGRTSDGCQTYEGYHQMYDACPVELSNRGYRFDCGIWTNNRYVKPEGPCVVCGTN